MFCSTCAKDFANDVIEEHLIQHLKAGAAIVCPYCKASKITTHGAWKSHKSRAKLYHGSRKVRSSNVFASNNAAPQVPVEVNHCIDSPINNEADVKTLLDPEVSSHDTTAGSVDSENMPSSAVGSALQLNEPVGCGAASVCSFVPRRSTRQRLRRTAEDVNSLALKEAERVERELLQVRDCGPSKGRGVFASCEIKEGVYIAEYCGRLLKRKEALEVEERLQQDEDTSRWYLYFFTYGGQKMCVDATADDNLSKGRLINHSRLQPNCKTKLVVVEKAPHLLFVTTRDLVTGEEIFYDYGETDSEAIKHNPWLKT